MNPKLHDIYNKLPVLLESMNFEYSGKVKPISKNLMDHRPETPEPMLEDLLDDELLEKLMNEPISENHSSHFFDNSELNYLEKVKAIEQELLSTTGTPPSPRLSHYIATYGIPPPEADDDPDFPVPKEYEELEDGEIMEEESGKKPEIEEEPGEKGIVEESGQKPEIVPSTPAAPKNVVISPPAKKEILPPKGVNKGLKDNPLVKEIWEKIRKGGVFINPKKEDTISKNFNKRPQILARFPTKWKQHVYRSRSRLPQEFVNPHWQKRSAPRRANTVPRGRHVPVSKRYPQGKTHRSLNLRKNIQFKTPHRPARPFVGPKGPSTSQANVASKPADPAQVEKERKEMIQKVKSEMYNNFRKAMSENLELIKKIE